MGSFYWQIAKAAAIGTPEIVGLMWIAVVFSIFLFGGTFIADVIAQESYKQATTWPARLAAVGEHWKRSARTGAIVTLIGWVILFVISLARTIYVDHATLAAQASETPTLTSERDQARNERDSYKGQRDSLQAENDKLRNAQPKTIYRDRPVPAPASSATAQPFPQAEHPVISVSRTSVKKDGNAHTISAMIALHNGSPFATTAIVQEYQVWNGTRIANPPPPRQFAIAAGDTLEFTLPAMLIAQDYSLFASGKGLLTETITADYPDKNGMTRYTFIGRVSADQDPLDIVLSQWTPLGTQNPQ